MLEKKGKLFKIQFVLSVFLTHFYVFSQNTLNLQIKGAEELIPYANVTLSTILDTTIIKGASANEKGMLRFENMPPTCLLQVFAIGYKDYLEPIYAPYVDSLRIIILQPKLTSLNEVVVSGKKPLFEHKAGSMIMNVGARTIATENNAWELIKKMPGVTVDNGNVSLYGLGITVMINDRPSYLSGLDLENMLKNMPAGSVDLIETKSNPSSEYDAEGLGGIINIKTQKTQMLGFNGSVYTGLGYSRNLKHMEGFNLNYRSPKVYLQAAFGYNGSTTDEGQKSQTVFPNGSKQTINWGSNSRSEKYTDQSKYEGLFWNIGIDYYVNTYNTLNLSFNQSSGKGKGEGKYYVRTSILDSILTSFEEKPFFNSHSLDNTLSLSYENSFDSTGNRKLTIDLFGLYNTSSYFNNDNIFNYEGDFLSFKDQSFYIQDLDYSSKMLSLKLNYRHVFNQSHRMSVGGKFSFVEKNDSHYYQGNWLSDTSSHNDFTYKENIDALYAQYAYTYPSGEIQLGLRGEFSLLEIHQKSLNLSNYPAPYFDLFPSVSYMQKLDNEDHILNLGYRYRLSRPRYSWLNLFEIRRSATSYWRGNANLKPEYAHIFDFMYSFKSNLFFQVVYALSTDDIQFVNYVILTKL